MSTAVIHAANECCSGRRVTVLAALRVGWSIYLPVVGTSVLYGSIVLLGLILVVPGIIAALGFLVIGQVMVVERSFGAEAMRRSRALMRGHRLRGLALVVVSGSLVLFLQSGVLLALATVPYLGYPLSALAQAIGLAYSIAVTVLFYFDVRCRSESYDLQLLAAAVQVRGASARTAGPTTPARGRSQRRSWRGRRTRRGGARASRNGRRRCSPGSATRWRGSRRCRRNALTSWRRSRSDWCWSPACSRPTFSGRCVRR